MANLFPYSQTEDTTLAAVDTSALRLLDIPLPRTRLSRRTVRDIKAYQAQLEAYRNFVNTLRHYVVALEELRDVSAHCEVARLKRRLQQAHLRHRIAGLESPSTTTEAGQLDGERAVPRRPRLTPEEWQARIERYRQRSLARKRVRFEDHRADVLQNLEMLQDFIADLDRFDALDEDERERLIAEFKERLLSDEDEGGNGFKQL